jgi:hypothetical protein
VASAKACQQRRAPMVARAAAAHTDELRGSRRLTFIAGRLMLEKRMI